MNSARIGVIVPVFNQKREYFSECILSIVNQTYSNIEVLVIDDGSDAILADFYDSYCSQYHFIKVYHLDNHGVSYARNFGLSKLSYNTKYVVFVDSDDRLSKRYLRNLYLNISDDKCVVQSSYSIKSTVCNRLNNSEYYSFEINKKFLLNFVMPGFDKTDYRFWKVFRAVWGKIYNLSIIRNNSINFPENLKIGEDAIFNIKYFSYIEKLIYYPDSVYFYRNNINSANRRIRKDVFLERKKLLSEYVKLITEIDDDYVYVITAEKISSLVNVLKKQICLGCLLKSYKIWKNELVDILDDDYFIIDKYKTALKKLSFQYRVILKCLIKKRIFLLLLLGRFLNLISR